MTKLFCDFFFFFYLLPASFNLETQKCLRLCHYWRLHSWFDLVGHPALDSGFSGHQMRRAQLFGCDCLAQSHFSSWRPDARLANTVNRTAHKRKLNTRQRLNDTHSAELPLWAPKVQPNVSRTRFNDSSHPRKSSACTTEQLLLPCSHPFSRSKLHHHR